jgi:hypothetical protein
MRPRRDSFTSTPKGSDRRPAAHINSQPSRGWTKQELLDVCDLSPKAFDTIRKAARVKGPSHGGLSWVFSQDDILALIHRARSGTFTEIGPSAADAWEKLLNEPPESQHPSTTLG